MELIGLLLPFVIKVINKKIEDTDIRFLVAALVCAFVGVAINFIDTQFAFESLRVGFDSISTSIMFVFGLSQLSWNVVVKDDSIVKNALK